MATDQYGKAFALATSSTQLTTSVGANEGVQITTAKLINTTAAARLAYVYLANDGAAAGTANIIDQAVSIPANGSIGSNLTGANMIPGAKLYAYADASGVTLQLHGLLSDQTPRTY